MLPLELTQTQWVDVGITSQFLVDILKGLNFQNGLIPNQYRHEVAPSVFVIQTTGKRNHAFEKEVQKAVKEGRIVGPVTITDEVNIGGVDLLRNSCVYGPVNLKGTITESYIKQLPAHERRTVRNSQASFVIPGASDASDLNLEVYEGPFPLTAAGKSAILATELEGNAAAQDDIDRLQNQRRQPLAPRAEFEDGISVSVTPVIDIRRSKGDSFFAHDERATIAVSDVSDNIREVHDGIRMGIDHVTTIGRPKNDKQLLRTLQELRSGEFEHVDALPGAKRKMTIQDYRVRHGINRSTAVSIVIQTSNAQNPAVADLTTAESVKKYYARHQGAYRILLFRRRVRDPDHKRTRFNKGLQA